MTEPATQPTPRPSREEHLIEWYQRNRRVIGIAVAVLVVAGGVYWYRTKSAQLANEAADRALNTALGSVQAGNQALAESDLQKVVARYGDTQSGVEAGLILAQIQYGQGKYDAGLGVLQSLLTHSAAELDATAIQSMIGDGQMQAGHASAAAAAYQKAADAANSAAARAFQLSKAARAYLRAGDTATASGIWQKLVSDTASQGVASEARVRLGEIQATPATKG